LQGGYHFHCLFISFVMSQTRVWATRWQIRGADLLDPSQETPAKFHLSNPKFPDSLPSAFIMSTLPKEISEAARAAALRSCPLFSALSAQDLEKIAGFASLKRVGKGEFLFREGEPTSGFYVVRSGAINVHRIAPDGREKTIHIFRSGESFAEATLPDGTGYPAHACAVEEGQVVFIPRTDFLDLLKQRPDLSLRMLASMSQHLRILVNSLDDLTQKDVETRLAIWLMKRCPKPLTDDPTDITLDVTKTILAAELRVRSETLSRVLAKMKSLGLFETTGRTIKVLSPLKLEAWLAEGREA
jgi:CRP/FNR family transcriptional regulator